MIFGELLEALLKPKRRKRKEKLEMKLEVQKNDTTLAKLRRS